MKSIERTDYNGNLRKVDVGREVVLCGWASKVRKLGGITFIDLRDSTGIVQLTVNDPDSAPDVRSEYVIQAKGKVALKKDPNPALKTGEVEVIVSEINVFNKAETTPFIIADKTDALEETRLQYRYLDIRRPYILNKLKARAKIVKDFHEYFDEKGFLEVDTPALNVSSPEGAKEYLVPSRVHHGSFYALPQSPQLWKQLLMIGGVERYYQVAKCFRDEDLRADRQPEFTQLDEEVSFLNQDEILALNEGFLAKIFKDIANYDVPLPLRRIPYWEAMDTYGSDKPDTRYGLTLHDLKPLLGDVPFKGFEGQEYIKGIIVPGQGKETSRKVLDELNVEARKFNLKGVLSLKLENGALEGSFAKFLDDEHKNSVITSLDLHEDDLVLLASSNYRRDIDFGLGALRALFAKK